MVSRELKSYIIRQLQTHSLEEIKNELTRIGWQEKDIQKTFDNIFKPISAIKIFFIVLLVFILLGAAYSYFFIISPVFVPKPELIKPEIEIPKAKSEILSPPNILEKTELFKSEHIKFLLNELGIYKLHNSPTGDPPRINFVISDIKKVYAIEVNNGEINVTEGAVSSPDIEIESNQNSLISIYEANETKKVVLDYYNKGLIKIDVVADVATLALKGYKSLYDYFGITGAASRNINLEKKDYLLAAAILLIVVLIFLTKFYSEK